MKLTVGVGWHPAQVFVIETNESFGVVLQGVGIRNPDCGRIVVERVNRVVAKFRCRDREDSGACAHVEKGLRICGPSSSNELFETENRRRMLPRAKAKAGVKHNDSLV